MRKLILLCTAVLPLLLVHPVGAQPRRGGQAPLAPGTPLPEVEIYDDAGKPFNTKSLKGKYTVIVNGCLT